VKHIQFAGLMVGAVSVVASLTAVPASAAPIPGCVPDFRIVAVQPMGIRNKTIVSAAYDHICEKTQMAFYTYRDIRGCGYADILVCSPSGSSNYTLNQNCGNYDPCAGH
jgi:hypothetical protein